VASRKTPEKLHELRCFILSSIKHIFVKTENCGMPLESGNKTMLPQGQFKKNFELASSSTIRNTPQTNKKHNH